MEPKKQYDLTPKLPSVYLQQKGYFAANVNSLSSRFFEEQSPRNGKVAVTENYKNH